MVRQVEPLLNRLTVAWNDSKEHIMASTLKEGGARAAVTSVRIMPHVHSDASWWVGKEKEKEAMNGHG